jgi:hypothetical protein
MWLDFVLAGTTGQVDISVAGTTDPAGLAAAPGSLGLAVCEATVHHPGRGYTGMLGWIQLVRSTDNASAGLRFEMDPLEILGEVGHPFCFFGIKPTLFDAPARDTRDDMSWMAHSFLTRIAHDTGREVRALLGFSWGFTISGGDVAITPPARLGSDAWQHHLPILSSEHPAWTFATDLPDPQ